MNLEYILWLSLSDWLVPCLQTLGEDSVISVLLIVLVLWLFQAMQMNHMEEYAAVDGQWTETMSQEKGLLHAVHYPCEKV